MFLLNVACVVAPDAATLYYGSVTEAGTAIYSVDTGSGVQVLEMTIDGLDLRSLASSPVPDALYGMARSPSNGPVSYECLHLIEIRIRRDRIVGCHRMLADFITFDPRHDTLYGGLNSLTTFDQRTAAPTPFVYFGIVTYRGDQGMALAYDNASDQLFGAGVFSLERGFYSIDKSTAVPTKIGASTYRALFVDPLSGALFGITPDFDTPGTPELHVVDKSTGAGTRIATLTAPGSVAGLAAPRVGSPTITLVEYYHAVFDHYFVTGNASEIAKLDSGVITGWARTGEQFAAFPPDSYGTANTCRFFSAAFAPKSSHFFAADARECAAVKDIPAWLFEGEVFAQVLSPPDGGCSAGLQSLYRLYNNGLGGAPAHRYTVRDAVRAAQIQRGWIPEGAGVGVVACVPPSGASSGGAEGVWVGTSQFSDENVETIVLDSGAFYQLYFNYGIPGIWIKAVVQGVGTTKEGETFTSTSATAFGFPLVYGDGSVGNATASGLEATYTPEASLSGKAISQSPFGSAYQVGYRSQANLKAVEGTYQGTFASMLIGTSYGLRFPFVVSAQGVFSAAVRIPPIVAPCNVLGLLTPRETVNVFDFTVELGGEGCPNSPTPIRGVAYFDDTNGTLAIVAVNDKRADAFGFFGQRQ
ncbi:MAG: hypothetical protein U1F54_12265 [Burkholderiales bacterium]